MKSDKKSLIGMRTLKTAIAATICAIIYYFFNANPTFACIGAIFGLGRDKDHSIQNGGNRAWGTLIGGLIGMALFSIYLKIHPEGENSPLLWLFLFVGVILLIQLCRKAWVGGIQPGGVILCILFFNTPIETFAFYAVRRIFDTFVGVMIAFAVNYIIPSRFDGGTAEPADT